MEIATPSSLQPFQYLDNRNSSDSMSQDFHQNIFSFSNCFDRSEQQQQQQQIRRDKLRTQILGAAAAPPPLVGMEEDGLPSYESGGIFSEMFNFSSGGAATATELLEPLAYRDPRSAAADWFLHRHGAVAVGDLVDSKNDDAASYNHHQISSIDADSMQPFLMNPQRRRSPPPSPSASNSLHMLLPNPSSSSSFHAAAGGGFGQFTWASNNPKGIVEGQGLSLSLSSSLEAAKAEEMRLGLLFQQGGGVAPPQLKNFGGGAGPSFGGVNALNNSKYLKAAQDLLEEFCSVGKGHFKKNKVGRRQNDNTDGGGATAAAGRGGDSSKDIPPLTASERFEHQRRKVKLSSMLDEVDRRYNHYCEQMQMVVNSFDMIMGLGAAAPYTRLAQKAMSRHFRCLREAISEQLKQSCEQLGDKDISKSGLTKGETPRLKFLEQSLRQQRAFHQMGMAMEQEAWRPQRGLPQRSLTILRAWLFEHFLNPYPSDADKHLLARQTGLSRNQVANWFINARVRLWKPMVEEMYLQEAKDESQQPSRDQTSTSSAAQTTAAAAVTPPPAANINVHENDPSFVSFNASENRPDTNHVSLPTSTAALPPQCSPAAMHEAETCRKLPASAGIEPAMVRFGTRSSGDVSLTLGLRHDVRDFGSF